MSESGAPLRVLHVTDGSQWGGIEAHLSSLLCASRLRGGELDMEVALTQEGGAARRLRAEGAAPVVLGGTRAAKAAALRRWVGAHRPAIVHAHGYLGAALGWVGSFGGSAALVTTLHGALDPNDGPTSPVWWYARSVKRLLLASRCPFIAVSSGIAEDWVRRGIPRDRLTVVHNGIAASDSRPHDPGLRRAGPVAGDRFRVGIVGRLVPVKDHHLFLQVARGLRTRREQVNFTVIGDGPLRGDLEREVQRLELSDCVSFLGFREDAAELVRDLDVLVFTSESEGIPYALLEAMSAGVPTVAPRVGGLPEILDDGFNARVPERTAAAFIDAIDGLLGDGSQREQLSRGALERVSGELSAGVMFDRTVAVYRLALTPGST